MKLRTLAIAVAMASVPFAAQADLKISGDVGAAYMSSSESIDQFGSEVNFDASEKIGGLTYGGHMGLQYGESSGASLNEGRVHVEGGFGKVILGHHDNGCNTVDIGGTNEIILTHSQGGCKGESDGNLVFTRGIGNFTGAISHNPGAEQSTLGIKGALGPVGISLGYETEIANAAGGMDNNLVLGLTGKIGPFAVGFRGNQIGDDDAVHGVNAIFTRGANSLYGGVGTSDGNDSKSLGFTHTRGKSNFIIEAADAGGAGDDMEYAIGMRHNF